MWRLAVCSNMFPSRSSEWINKDGWHVSTFLPIVQNSPDTTVAILHWCCHSEPEFEQWWRATVFHPVSPVIGSSTPSDPVQGLSSRRRMNKWYYRYDSIFVIINLIFIIKQLIVWSINHHKKLHHLQQQMFPDIFKPAGNWFDWQMDWLTNSGSPTFEMKPDCSQLVPRLHLSWRALMEGIKIISVWLLTYCSVVIGP